MTIMMMIIALMMVMIVILGNYRRKLDDAFGKPGVMIEEEEVESDTKWTDLSLLEHGSLTALEIEENEYGLWIQRIRAR